MRNLRNWTVLPVLALLVLGLPGCNEESPTLDDPDDANSVLEITNATPPTANAGGDVSDGNCIVTISNMTVTLANKPKSASALGSPFNDITLMYVNLHYTWDDPSIVTADRQFSLAGTVPIGGTASVQFGPIAFGDFTTAMQGHTANIFMTIHGRAISGEPVAAQGGVGLSVGGACTL